MRVVLLANGDVGRRVADVLREAGAEIVAVVVHDPEAARCRDDIIAACGVPEDRVLEPAGLRTDEGLARLRGLGADVAFSAFFGHILRPPFLELFSRGVLNVHPSYLPWNRGAHPNVWSIVEGTPAGATIHVVDEGVDTGDIVAQTRVDVRADDTGETLYRRLEDACVELVRATWPDVVDGRVTRVPQDPDAGTAHRVRDLARLDEIDLDEPTTARELLDRLRARTFPPHPGCWFRADGRRISVRVELLDAGDAPEEDPGGES